MRGYLFYHGQDTESAVEDGDLYFNYGTCEEGKEAALAIGEAIRRTMMQQGFTVDWDGTWGKRIAIQLDRKCRR